MRRAALITLLCLSTHSGAVELDYKHLAASAGAHMACSWLLGRALHLEASERWQTRIMCAVAVGTVGLTKEYMDAFQARRSGLDAVDLQSNALGIGLGAGLSWFFEF